MKERKERLTRESTEWSELEPAGSGLSCRVELLTCGLGISIVLLFL